MTIPKTPKFIVLGEAPGQIEDRKGQSFTGPAGMFLRRSLQRVGLFPSDGVWMNVVSCYPSERKTPTADEVEACRVNLAAQLSVLSIRPTLLVGAMALQAILPHATLTYAQGAPILAHSRVLFPVYHPAYILRSRQIQEGWDRQLSIFARMVKSGVVPTREELQHFHCLYCNAGAELPDPVCHKHKKWWIQDTIWRAPRTPKPEKLTLF